MTEKEIPTRYDHTKESSLYNEWEKAGLFEPAEKGQPYSIVMPPPNVTGNLHLGHVLVYAIHDIIARYKRRLGYSVMMLPGADHAAIAVEALVLKKVQKEQGLNRSDLGREKFLEEVWRWIEQYMPQIKDSFRQLGVSCDWNRFRFTMDEHSQTAVTTAFIKLYEKGLIYRGEYLVNWDAKLQTAVSDDEVNYQEVPGHLYWIKYGPITVATTRPETKLGDTAIAVHPTDKRYTQYVGKELEFTNEQGLTQKLPVIADEAVDPEFGTGALKVTPSHDHVDWALGKKHQLEFKQIIDVYGRMTETTGPYAGLKVLEAREKIVADLQAKGLLEKITDYPLRQPVSQRSGAIIEPLPSTQWFMKTTELKDKALKVVKSGQIKFFPKSVEKTYYHWLENLHDWCISRQLWWGHQIPAYYCTNKGATEYVVAATKPKKCPMCGQCEMRQEVDVLDTWFSSGTWPFSTLGWPNTDSPDLKKYFPTDLLITAQDILFFWVARMIMMSEALMGDIPFKDVYFHGLVLDEKGQKMSKSKGNTTDPVELLEKYGADTLRMALLGNLGLGQDQRYSEQKVLKYRNFITKVWNASRFVALTTEGAKSDIKTEPDHVEQEFLKKLSALEEKNQKLLGSYQLGLALEELYEFFWHEFADQFLEYEKKVILEADEASRATQSKILLRNSLERQLILLGDFAPLLVASINKEILT